MQGMQPVKEYPVMDETHTHSDQSIWISDGLEETGHVNSLDVPIDGVQNRPNRRDSEAIDSLEVDDDINPVHGTGDLATQLPKVQREQPDIGMLLKLFRMQAGELDSHDRVDSARLVQRISQRIASLPELQPSQPDVEFVLRKLHKQAGQFKSHVRFHDVGTVQHIGNGVATLSGLPDARIDELVTFPTGVQGLVLNPGKRTLQL